MQYDYEEGVKKYTKRVYNELLEIVQGVLPEGQDEREEKMSTPQFEEIKEYHKKQYLSWKNGRTYMNFRGGGAHMQRGSGGLLGGMSQGQQAR